MGVILREARSLALLRMETFARFLAVCFIDNRRPVLDTGLAPEAVDATGSGARRMVFEVVIHPSR